MVRRTLFALAAVAFVTLTSPALADEEKPGTHEGKVVKVEANKLTMTDKEGKKEHSHAVPADAKVTCDGRECKLEDLKPGFSIKVTTEKQGDKVAVTKIEAKKAD